MINKTYSVNIGEYQLAMATAYKLLKLSIISVKDLAFIEEKTAKNMVLKNTVFIIDMTCYKHYY